MHRYSPLHPSSLSTHPRLILRHQYLQQLARIVTITPLRRSNQRVNVKRETYCVLRLPLSLSPVLPLTFAPLPPCSSALFPSPKSAPMRR
jgi:hypothetical protein